MRGTDTPTDALMVWRCLFGGLEERGGGGREERGVWESGLGGGLANESPMSSSQLSGENVCHFTDYMLDT